MAKNEEEIRLTNSQLQEVIASSVAAALRGMQEASKPNTIQEQAKAARELPPVDVTVIPDVRSQTGATMDLHVAHGIVCQIPNYRYPEGIEAHQDDGGIVPNGMPIRDGNGALTTVYKDWKYDEFWKADLNTFVGRPVPHWARSTKAA